MAYAYTHTLQKRDQLSLMAAHKLIERTNSVLESMANKNGEKIKEVNSACEQKEFKGIEQKTFCGKH